MRGKAFITRQKQGGKAGGCWRRMQAGGLVRVKVFWENGGRFWGAPRRGSGSALGQDVGESERDV
ncbi:hypothetical protein D1093_09435 [Bartonella kosoyi]|uniref:Uncharacterized protein n=1 Tax=Bartonella kosoyi TaxID=2133959 RepID=A0A5B9CZR1_9HYPH|nr:hypothetical protein [Bartonella kosoyi]QEE09775.1 hypothetical protein D1093_09435 [Bartonella kosoyi]